MILLECVRGGIVGNWVSALWQVKSEKGQDEGLEPGRCTEDPFDTLIITDMSPTGLSCGVWVLLQAPHTWFLLVRSFAG